MNTFLSKKKWGQHFLNSQESARRIVAQLSTPTKEQTVVEVGAGKGALSRWLVEAIEGPLYLVEIDPRLVDYLQGQYHRQATIVEADFLTWPLSTTGAKQLTIIGNFPYCITAPLLFKLLEARKQVSEIVCMIQEEVARRIVAPPGGRTPGLMSLLFQAFYQVEYLFSLPPKAFSPPPRVTSVVIKLVRHQDPRLSCDEGLFFQLVKTGFRKPEI